MFPAYLQSNSNQQRVQAGMFVCLVLLSLCLRCSSSPAGGAKDRSAVSPDHPARKSLFLGLFQRAVVSLRHCSWSFCPPPRTQEGTRESDGAIVQRAPGPREQARLLALTETAKEDSIDAKG